MSAKFKVGDRVVFNSVKTTPKHFSRFDGIEATIAVVHPTPLPGTPNPQSYNVQFPNEPMQTWAEEPELTAVPSAVPATALNPTGNPRYANVTLEPVPTSDGLTSNVRKIEPKCPACGFVSEFNYVGFSSVECANWSCKFAHVEAFKKHVEKNYHG